MRTRKQLLILTYGSILLGFLVSVGLVAWDIHVFHLVQTPNLSNDELTANATLLTQRLSWAVCPMFLGLLCGLAGMILILLQSRRTPPSQEGA